MVRNSATEVYKVQKKVDSMNKMFKDENSIREFMLSLKMKNPEVFHRSLWVLENGVRHFLFNNKAEFLTPKAPPYTTWKATGCLLHGKDYMLF